MREADGLGRPPLAGVFHGTARFEIVGQLGEGGMGVVYEVLDRERNVRVALKTLREIGPRELLLFKDEFRAARDLSHPGVIRLGELVEDHGRWLFTMELVRGQPLAAYVGLADKGLDSSRQPGQDIPTGEDLTVTRTVAPEVLAQAMADAVANDNLHKPQARERGLPAFDEARLRSVLRQLALAVHALHGRGIVHRDIKPSNVLVTAEGRAVLLDFGIAVVDNESAGAFELAGSPVFMAPEQLEAPAVGPAADWYALGTVLFYALTGEPPFAGPMAQMIARKRETEAPDPDSYVRDLPPDLTALCRALLRRDPQARPAPEQILHELGAPVQRDLQDVRLRAPFVGREVELAVLANAFARTQAGAPGAVFIEGESGIGKSACVDEFLSRLARLRPTVLVVRGRCHEREAVPYKAFDSIVDALARTLAARPHWLPADRQGFLPLVGIFPVLASIPGFAPTGGAALVAPGGDVRELAFPALRSLLSSVAAHRTLVMTVDDVQWADPDSLGLLESLFGADLFAPLFLVATARPMSDGRPCAAFDAVQTRAERLLLGRLPEGDAQTLVQEVLRQLPPDVAARAFDVASAAGGHPMFIGELALHLSSNPAVSARAVDLDEAIRLRVARLDAGGRLLVQTAAVAGVPITHLAARRVTGLEAQTYAELCDRLVRQQLLRVTGHGDKDTIQPYHDRVREAVRAPLETEALRSLQAALGAALEGCGAEPALIAAFYDAAGERKTASLFAVQAAARANRVLAFDRAAEFYQMALLGVDADPGVRQELLTHLGTALQRAGRREESAAAFDVAATLADPHTRLVLQQRAGHQLLTGGYIARGLRTLDEAMSSLGLSMPRSTSAMWLRSAYQFIAMLLAKTSWKEATAEEKQGRDAIRADLTFSVASGLSMTHTVRSLYFVFLNVRLVLALGCPARIAQGMCGIVFATCALGLPKLSRRFIAAAARAAEQDGTPFTRYWAEGSLFVQAFLTSHDWPRTLSLHRRISTLWNEAGLGRSVELDVIDQVASWALANQGHYAQLTNRVHKLVAAAHRAGNPFLSTGLRAYHAITFLAADDPEGAWADLDDVLRTWRPAQDDFQIPEAWALFSRAEILLYRGDAHHRAQLTPMYRSLRRSLLDQINWVRVRRDHSQARLCLAHAAMTEGKTRNRALREARLWLRRARREGSPSALAWASLGEAALAHMSGDEIASHSALRTAIRCTSALELGAFSEAARFRLAQSGGVEDAQTEMNEVYGLLRARGIKEPSRMLTVLAPGWPLPCDRNAIPESQNPESPS